MTLQRSFAALAAGAGLALASMSAAAAPMFTTFGSLPAATFGGTGIPNDAVAITNWSGGGASATLGLTAFGRFGLSPVTNDGAGTFTALAGTNDPPGPPANGALWNFGFFVDASDTFAGFAELRYDVDPSAGTDFGVIRIPIVGTAAAVQDSQNLLFGFLYTPVPLVLTPPAGTFDPFAAGIYSFQIDLFRNTFSAPLGTRVATVGIDVRVVSEPGMALLAGIGLALLGFARRRSRS